MVNPVFLDPFFYGGILFFIVHLIQYYKLLDKIAEKIKLKRDEETDILKKRIHKKLKPNEILEIHKNIHRIVDRYEVLDSKVSMVFNSGIAIFVLCVAGWLRNFSGFFNNLVNLVIVGIIIAIIVFFINLISLLSWNLKNK